VNWLQLLGCEDSVAEDGEAGGNYPGGDAEPTGGSAR
jgi:hypothetical protein